MNKYSAAITFDKGVAGLLWGVVAAAVGVALTDIGAGGATPTLEQIAVTAIAGLIVSGISAFNNWRKHDPRVPTWLATLDLVPILKQFFPALVLGLAFGIAAGCVHTRVTYPDGRVEDTWVPDGGLIGQAIAALPQVVDAIEAVKKDDKLTPEEREAKLEELRLKQEMLIQIINAAKETRPTLPTGESIAKAAEQYDIAPDAETIPVPAEAAE